MSAPVIEQTAPLPTRVRSCILCDGASYDVVYEAKLPALTGASNVLHYQYEEAAGKNTWHYRLVRCRNCGHVYANPIFAEEVVESSYLQQDHDNQFGLDETLLLRTNSGYASLAEPHLPGRDRRLLQVDLGCDTGLFLQATAQFGFRRVVGVEPGVDSANRARQLPGVEVLQKIFSCTDFAEGTIDFLSLIHVLDHLVDPRQLLREVRPLMARSGLVLAVVHNIESLIARVSGENWPVINLVHFDYFTPGTLRRLFQAENYRVLAVRQTTNYFPLSHLIRFSPFLPTGLRSLLARFAAQAPLNRAVLGLRLGNIAVLATVD